MTVPAEKIAARSRTIRTRRRVPLLTGALAGVAGAALAVTTMLSPAPQVGQPVHAKLAAWTVTTRADGDIQVTVRDTSDAAGLERRLRAEGLPVAVRFNPKFRLGDGGPIIPGCRSLHENTGLPNSPESLASLAQLNKVVNFYPDLDDSGDWKLNEGDAALLIHPSALPDGAGLAFVFFEKDELNFVPMATDLVQKSQECTGS